MTGPALFVPGRSLVHRSQAGAKLALLVVAAAASTQARAPWQSGGLLLLALGVYAAARLPWGALAFQMRPLVPVLLVVGLLQAWVAGPTTAAVVVGGIAALVVLATAVTLTTRTTELVDALVAVLRPLRRVGVDPDRVALLLAVSIRSVTVVGRIAQEIREAQRARGVRASPRAYGVPLVIRSLRHAEQLGEALVARGVDD